MGFVCTLQISTYKNDFIIDTLMLHEDVKIHLRNLFESVKYLKIFHAGTDSDIKWLKKDFGFNTMNVFDTSKASMIMQNNMTQAISLKNIVK